MIKMQPHPLKDVIKQNNLKNNTAIRIRHKNNIQRLDFNFMKAFK